MPFWVEVLLVGAVAVIALAGNVPRPNLLRSIGNAFARDYLLWIAPGDAGAVDDAHRAVVRENSLSIVMGLGFYGAARLLAPAQVVMWAALCATAATMSVLRVRRAGRDFVPAPGAPAVARVRAVGLRDYLATQHLMIMASCPVLAAGLALGGAWAVRAKVGNIDTAWFVTVTGASLAVQGLVLAVLAVLMARRPVPAADEPHLYLQDAWRAERLREMLRFEALGVAVLFVQAHNLIPVTSVLSHWVVLTVFLPVGILVAFEVGRLHFRRRLWPDLAKGEKVVIGRTEAVA